MRPPHAVIGEFARHTFTLMTGTLVAQAIPIAVSPLLTRLYSPAEFGIFAIYTALTAVLAVASTGRYELALNLPRRDLVAVHLVVLASAWLAAFSLGVSALMWLVIPQASVSLGWIYGLLPVSIALSGSIQIFNYWFNRQKRYRDIAISRALQGAGFAAISVLFGIYGLAEGMALGFMAGQFSCIVYLIARSIPDFRRYGGQIRKSTVTRTAIRYGNFPRVLIFAHTLNLISSRLPVLLMPVSFGTAAAGFYSLTQQVIGIPMQLAGGAIGDVFRQQASVEFHRTGSCVGIYLRTLRILAALYLAPFLVLIFLSPALFSFVFGDSWHRAGVLAQILAPMFYVQFVCSPLSSMFLIAEKQQEDLLWQAALLVITGGALGLGWIYGSIEVCVTLFSASYCIMYVVNLSMTYGFAKGQRKVD